MTTETLQISPVPVTEVAESAIAEVTEVVLEHEVDLVAVADSALDGAGVVLELAGTAPKPTTEVENDKVLRMPSHYEHIITTEAANPAMAELAWRIHAEGYHTMGFVHKTAIAMDGALTTDIDKARGDNVEYFLAINDVQEIDAASLRKVHIPEGGDYTDLPAYKLCEPQLSEPGKQLLADLSEDGHDIIEIGALARTASASPYAVHELFRNIVHGSAGKNEAWLFSIVSTTFDSLASSFGKDSFIVLGEDTPIVDDRVSNGVKLRPAVLIPDLFIDNVLAQYEAATNRVQRHKLLRTFMFFTEGLEDNELSEHAAQARAMIATASVPAESA
ncbi:MAG: hypothetical protein JWN38_999 [Candidatus Saccharibacteria bacterium]|nr:hypothetical protein [Candidatus Saccharibacteria bacterium]